MTYISYYSKDLINSGDIYLSLSQSTLITYNCHYNAKYLIYSRDVGLLRVIIPNILSTLVTHIICYYAKDLLSLSVSLFNFHFLLHPLLLFLSSLFSVSVSVSLYLSLWFYIPGL